MYARTYVEHSGRINLGYMPGAFLGAISDAEMATAEAAGIDAQTLADLSSLGATDADIADVLAGNSTLQDVLAKYYPAVGISNPGNLPMTLPTGSAQLLQAVEPAPPPIVPASASLATPIPTPAPSTAQSPGGSVLNYQASWPGVDGLPTGVIQQLQSELSAYGMSISSSQVTGNGLLGASAIQLSIADSVGHNLLTDAKSVLDSLIQQIIGNNLTSSSITLTSTPPTGAAPATGTAATNLTSWVEQNAMWIAIFGVIVFIGPGLIKKL